jgi:4-hydroxy-3-polyprenylbenzoate decarboxylase
MSDSDAGGAASGPTNDRFEVQYDGLREWIERAREMEELAEFRGVDWDVELGAIAEIMVREHAEEAPAMLFDDIEDYPEGFRCLYATLNSPRRLALTLGMPTDGYKDMPEYLHTYRDRTKDIDQIPRRTVDSGPVFENTHEGEDVDITEFPVPVHHEEDGGRYIGTADLVVTRDPDDGWVNVGTYRTQVRDEQTALSYISPGKDGRLQRDKYLDRDGKAPVAIVVGHDPLIWLASTLQVPTGTSEYEYAGGLKGEAIDVVEGDVTGLPFPADAEIVLEGYVTEEKDWEGPFGEWPGYYAGGKRLEHVFEVEKVYHRDDPILMCSASNKPPHEHLFERCVSRSSRMWEELERAGVPDIDGVWVQEPGEGRTFNVVSINQRYAGHATQVGTLMQHVTPARYSGRWSVVVDEDIDPTNLDEVLWAMSTRVDPERDIQTMDRCWTSKIDPTTIGQDPESDAWFNSRAVVDATIPYEHREEFPPVAASSDELREEIFEKWGEEMREAVSEREPPIGR